MDVINEFINKMNERLEQKTREFLISKGWDGEDIEQAKKIMENYELQQWNEYKDGRLVFHSMFVAKALPAPKKLYYARDKEGRALEFEGEVLFSSCPTVFEYLVKAFNNKAFFGGECEHIRFTDFEIVEVNNEGESR